ncbi:MAG: site-specific DNA-methyltransferase, partial [Candidatus Parvarchaeota archaeon]|nr:site-specific DNA-methyltransferase [Candidatus Jingweiarchaeum tengchongense]
DRFYFNWSGKSQLFKLIQAPAYGTLKPIKEKSVDFDKTENIVIAGENLETLKFLLKPYFGKVKMIYIDPPYNTGKDFIYRDNFKQPLKDYLEKTGQIDSEGKKLTTNTEASGRYHSDWLNFIYPRLFLARNLLRDDGVIFVSIDDNEVHHLRMIMDEIFGEENVEMMIWYKIPETGTAGQGKMKMTTRFRVDHEYVLIGYRNKNETVFDKPLKLKSFKNEYQNPDNDPRGNWVSCELCKSEEKSNPKGKNYYTVKTPKGIEITRQWHITKEEFEQLDADKRIYWGDGTIIPRLKRFTGEPQPVTPSSIIKNISQTQGNRDLKEIFDGRLLYNNPKPVELISWLVEISTTQDSIILDFFAGSGTTGHAVWDLNKEDGGNRKFILVQIDEEVLDEGIKKEFPTVADICIERLRRVSEKYKKESPNQDFGFKVFKLDKSNFNLKDEFEFDPSEDKEELKKKYLEWLGMWVNQPLVSDWKEIDVIYEVTLKEGLNLNSKIEQVKIKNCEFYYVKDEEQNLDFYIYLKDKIDKDTIEEIRTPKYKGKTFILLDNILTDSDKINLSAFVRLKVI